MVAEDNKMTKESFDEILALEIDRGFFDKCAEYGFTMEKNPEVVQGLLQTAIEQYKGENSND